LTFDGRFFTLGELMLLDGFIKQWSYLKVKVSVFI